MRECLKLNQEKDGTHLKTAIYESYVCAGEVKPSFELSDGALHVGPCQGLGEVGEGQCNNKQLKNKGKWGNACGTLTLDYIMLYEPYCLLLEYTLEMLSY